MASRVTSAVLALIAAGLLAAAIFSQRWWSGHPEISGQTRHLQDVHIGPLGGELCNTGGDGLCREMPLASTFTGVGLIVVIALGLAAVTLVILALLALIRSEARHTVGKIVFILIGASVIVSAAMIFLGPSLDDPVPAAFPLGGGVFIVGAGGLLAIVAGIVARRKSAPLQLRSAPYNAAQMAMMPSPLDLLAAGDPMSAMNPTTLQGVAPGPAPSTWAVAPAGTAIALPATMAPPGPVSRTVAAAHQPARPIGVPQSPIAPMNPSFGNPLAVGAGYASPGGLPGHSPAPHPEQPYQGNPFTAGPSSRTFPAPPGPIGAPPSTSPAFAAPEAPSRSYSQSQPSRSHNASQPPPFSRSHPTQPPPPPGSRSHPATQPPPAPTSRSHPATQPPTSRPFPASDPPSFSQGPSGKPLAVFTPAPPAPPPPQIPKPFVLPPLHQPAPVPASQVPPPVVRPAGPVPPRTSKPTNPTVPARPGNSTAPPLRGVVPMPAPNSRPVAPMRLDQVDATDRDSGFDAAATHQRDEDGTQQTQLPPDDLSVGDMTSPSVDIGRDDTDLADAHGYGRHTDSMLAPAFGSVTDAMPAASMGSVTDAIPAQVEPPPPAAASGSPVRNAASRTDVIPTLAAPPGTLSAEMRSTAPDSLPPPRDTETHVVGPSPACPQCEAPMAWVEAHLRFYCKSCKMYF